MLTPSRATFLVIGYGNELRRDDGLGPKLARVIEAEQLADVEVQTGQQLTPELAEVISAAEVVVFLDADAASVGPARSTPLDAHSAACIFPHSSQPAGLLLLAQGLFGACPEAWLIRLPAADFGFGEGLSGIAERSMGSGLQAFHRILERKRAGNEVAARA